MRVGVIPLNILYIERLILESFLDLPLEQRFFATILHVCAIRYINAFDVVNYPLHVGAYDSSLVSRQERVYCLEGLSPLNTLTNTCAICTGHA